MRIPSSKKLHKEAVLLENVYGMIKLIWQVNSIILQLASLLILTVYVNEDSRCGLFQSDSARKTCQYVFDLN